MCKMPDCEHIGVCKKVLVNCSILYIDLVFWRLELDSITMELWLLTDKFVILRQLTSFVGKERLLEKGFTLST